MSIALDNDFGHLWPVFRAKLRAAFADCLAHGLRMQMSEGYRSRERQHWLYQQGRTRPGLKVTGLWEPIHHGAGLAADCYPVHGGRMVFAFTNRELATWHAAMKAHGLQPTRFAGDLGHCELIVPNAVRQQALLWVRAGFPVAKPDPGIRVTVDGQLVTAAKAFMDEHDHAFGWVRPIASALKLTIVDFTPSATTLARGPVRATIASEQRGGKNYLPLAKLALFPGVRITWNGSTRTVAIEVK